MCKNYIKADVLIIGAGLAGLIAGRVAALAGARVLIIEIKQKIGIPSHCAGFIPQALALEIDIPNIVRLQAVKGMESRLGGESFFFTMPGWILDRQIYDFYLASLASLAGAEIWTGVKLVSYSNKKCLIYKRDESKLEILPSVIILADGAASLISQKLGLARPRLMPGVQVNVSLVSQLIYTVIFLRSKFRGGYAWLFPCGVTANLGVACYGSGNPSRQLEILRRELIIQGVIKPSILGFNRGVILVESSLKRLCMDNIILAGDAAGLAHPISGAGIPQALFSGFEAGKAAVALAGGEKSAQDEYSQKLCQRYGFYLNRGIKARSYWDQIWQTEEFIYLMYQIWPGIKVRLI